MGTALIYSFNCMMTLRVIHLKTAVVDSAWDYWNYCENHHEPFHKIQYGN